jgi:hypothetical protein
MGFQQCPVLFVAEAADEALGFGQPEVEIG